MGPSGRADAVLVAAGESRRMDGIDKLWTPLAGRPLLAWALDALAAAAEVRDIVVVGASDRVAELADATWLRRTGARVVAGGARRQESVAAGLAVTTASIVVVHDGARPFASPALVDAVVAAAAEHGAAIPVHPVAETVKRVVAGRVAETLDRRQLALAQTPQGARRDLLLAAFATYPAAGPAEFTDESALLEHAGVPVVTIAGEPDNVKVTTPADLRRAQAIAAGRRGPERIAQGRDRHPFGPQDGLALGGIVIPEAPRLHGHSDGDAALHAVADALLGGAGLGDLGRLFPAGDPATQGIASSRIVEEAARQAATAGWRPVALDLLIEGARPRLGAARLESMRAGLAELLALTLDAVSVRASTGNLDGSTGAGRTIAATALVTLARLTTPEQG